MLSRPLGNVFCWRGYYLFSCLPECFSNCLKWLWLYLGREGVGEEENRRTGCAFCGDIWGSIWSGGLDRCPPFAGEETGNLCFLWIGCMEKATPDHWHFVCSACYFGGSCPDSSGTGVSAGSAPPVVLCTPLFFGGTGFGGVFLSVCGAAALLLFGNGRQRRSIDLAGNPAVLVGDLVDETGDTCDWHIDTWRKCVSGAVLCRCAADAFDHSAGDRLGRETGAARLPCAAFVLQACVYLAVDWGGRKCAAACKMLEPDRTVFQFGLRGIAKPYVLSQSISPNASFLKIFV